MDLSDLLPDPPISRPSTPVSPPHSPSPRTPTRDNRYIPTPMLHQSATMVIPNEPSYYTSPESSTGSVIHYRWMRSAPDSTFPENASSSSSIIASPLPFLHSTTRTVAFLCNEELGQANVLLAAIYELLIIAPNIQIHVISWSGIASRVVDIEDSAQQHAKILARMERREFTERFLVIFHELSGEGMVKSLARRTPEGLDVGGVGGRGIKAARKVQKAAVGMFAGWEGDGFIEEYLGTAEEIVELLKGILPDLCVIDSAFSQAFDACDKLGQDLVVLSPNALKDICAFEQPFWKVLMKYPAMTSGFKYPVPFYLVLVNVTLVISMIVTIVRSKELKALNAGRQKRGFTGPFPIMEMYKKGRVYIMSSCPITDFPLKVADGIMSCGPIVLPVTPLATLDPELYEWLSYRPSVLIHFGSHFRADKRFCIEMSDAVCEVLSTYPHVQILWKLPKKEDYELGPLIREYMEHGRLRIVEWLRADPLSILETGHIVCVVHHGGANSFNEAVITAVPQVICAQWLDCYDYAARVEHLGIGYDGNKKVVNGVDGKEVATVIKAVIEDERRPAADGVKLRARGIGIRADKFGGRRRAAKTIKWTVENLY